MTTDTIKSTRDIKIEALNFIDTIGEDIIKNIDRKEYQKLCSNLSLEVRKKITSRRYYLRNSDKYTEYCRIKTKYNFNVPEEIRNQYVKRGQLSNLTITKNKLTSLCDKINDNSENITDDVREKYNNLILCI